MRTSRGKPPNEEQPRAIALNQTFEGDGAIIYKHAFALGCEGIVSKLV